MSTTPTAAYSVTRAVRTVRDITAFDEACTAPIDPTVFYSSVAGGGSVTHNAPQSTYVVGCGTAGGDSAMLRSHARKRASARHGRVTAITGKTTGVGLNNTTRWGAYSATDGWYFELDGTGLYVVRRSSVTGSVVNARVAKSSWSLGAANAYDTSTEHTYEIRDVWPGGAAEFLIDGQIVHVMPSTERIRSARLPVTIESVNASATVSSASFAMSSSTVLVDDLPRPDRTFAVESSATGFATATPLCAVRPLATVSSQFNDVELELATLSLVASAECLVQFVVGGTVTGTFATPTGSLGESCAAPSGITGGRVVASYRVASTLAVSGSDVFSDALKTLADSTVETLAIVVTSASGSPITVRAALVWRETR